MYTLLQAVNFVLRRSNETPVSSLSADSSSAATLAQSYIEDELQNVLGEGMQFNTVRQLFPPDNDGYIQFGDNVLAVTGYYSNKNDEYTIRDGRLFDTVDQTDVFTSSQYLQVIYRYDFADIPRWVQYRIMTRVALSFLSQFSPDPDQIRDLERVTRMAEIRCAEREFASRKIDMVAKSPLGRVTKSGVFRRIGD